MSQPDNLLVTADNHVKITDFGAALHEAQIVAASIEKKSAQKSRSRRASSIAKNRKWSGTPAFAAPETIKCKKSKLLGMGQRGGAG